MLSLLGLVAAIAAAWYARGPYRWMRADRKRAEAAEAEYERIREALVHPHGVAIELTAANKDAVELGFRRGMFKVTWNSDGRQLVSRAPPR